MYTDSMSQKKLTVITLFVVVLCAVSINEFIIRKSNQEQGREVASFGERYAPEQIKWEQELAKSVSRESGKTLLGTKPSATDKFFFEALQGKYEAQFNEGKHLKISLIQNQSALELNMADLIKNYAPVFKEAASFEQTTAVAGAENVVLKNAQGKSIGQVTIKRNDQGRVLSIEIQ